MPHTLAKVGHTWKFSCPTSAREVFAVMEQMMGTPPYRFEVVGTGEARIVEVSRLGFFGQWRKDVRRAAWVTVRVNETDTGAAVVVTSSRAPLSRTRGHLPGAPSRALQLVQLLTRGRGDGRTVYRDRRMPPGPTTLVASWAGTPYSLYMEPHFGAPRGRGIYTATRLVALHQRGAFVQVELADATGGWVERDQLVSAPAAAVRAAVAQG